MKKIAFLFALLGNWWIWKIFSFNLFLGVLVFTTSFYLIKSFYKGKARLPLIVFFALTLFVQFKTANKTPLTILSDQEKLVQIQRLNEYPPIFILLRNKTIWIPIAHWFEERKESIVFFKIQRNLSEVIDPNLYFFANHPRERVGFNEFEKFPYILLPFFLYGTFLLVVKKAGFIFTINLVLPILLISLTGNTNSFGPFSLFPFIALAIFIGFLRVFEKVRNFSPSIQKVFIAGFLVLYLLVFIQIISYANA